MDFETVNTKLFEFLDSSPVPFFAVRNMKRMLEDAGFSGLEEGRAWELVPGGNYYVSRNDSALIAFRIPKRDFTGFMMMASHCDSPVFRVKPNAVITVEKRYEKLNVEKYGGALFAPWLDRPLSVAGRVVVRTEEGIETKLVNVDRDLLIIPSLAIHMNREANDGFKYNAQTDLLPLFRETGEGDGSFLSLIAEEAGVQPDRILDMDLYLYSRVKAVRVGLNREFVASGRLDDLQCSFASLEGFLRAKPRESVAVHCVFDNEEVGSVTKQGAGGTFLSDVLHRINTGLGRSEEEYLRALASSFLVSADNAHSVHPNHPEKADPVNRPVMNGGIVIKYSANQKYTTDAVSGAVFRAVCREAGVPYQVFTNRSDMIGGSTLGNITQTRVSLNTVDIGLAQLAMHSPCETAGARDTAYLAEAARVLFSGSIRSEGDGKYALRF
ncbi:MAG: M18 family aminopeptidase [Eubacteriales bacterium]|nr:M18 family aminopeptidase [Eubacteriales bacterium]